MIARMRIIVLLCVLCVIFTGCSSSTLSVGVSGDSVVVEYFDDGVRQLITDGDDVKSLQDVFSGEYEEVKNYKEDQCEYIFYFGNDLDLELQSSEEYVNYAVIDGRAYVIDGDKVYKSAKEIDLSILDKYREETQN